MTLRFFFYIVMTLLLTISFTMRRFTSAIGHKDRRMHQGAFLQTGSHHVYRYLLCCNEIQELHNSVKWSAFTEIKLWLI